MQWPTCYPTFLGHSDLWPSSSTAGSTGPRSPWTQPSPVPRAALVALALQPLRPVRPAAPHWAPAPGEGGLLQCPGSWQQRPEEFKWMDFADFEKLNFSI